MALATMQKGNLDAIQPDVHGRIAKETVALEGTWRAGATSLLVTACAVASKPGTPRLGG